MNKRAKKRLKGAAPKDIKELAGRGQEESSTSQETAGASLVYTEAGEEARLVFGRLMFDKGYCSSRG